MDIRINPVGFSVNPVLEEFINKKFSKLEKYHDGIMSIDVYKRQIPRLLIFYPSVQ